MLTFLVVTVGIFLVLRFLPIRRKTLIEGVFKGAEQGFGWYGGSGIVYNFDAYCRDCLNNPKQRDRIMGCHEYIQHPAWKLSSLDPTKGDSIKIVGLKNVFGRVLIYWIERTDFAAETYDIQMREYEDDMTIYIKASDGNHAMREGLSVEEYRRRAKIRTKEFSASMKKMEIEGWLEKIRDTKSFNVGCLEHTEMDFWEYAETGTLPDQQALEHLKRCDECSKFLNQGHERYLSVSHKPECLSDEELALVEKTGKLSHERFQHTKRCYRCLTRFENRRKKHFENAPGPNCLTEDDCHVIHSTGEIPGHRKKHLTSCEHCSKEARRQKNIYIDNLVPIPPYPKRRLESLKK